VAAEVGSFALFGGRGGGAAAGFEGHMALAEAMN